MTKLERIRADLRNVEARRRRRERRVDAALECFWDMPAIRAAMLQKLRDLYPQKENQP